MNDSKSLMLTVLMASLVGLPIAIALDRATDIAVDNQVVSEAHSSSSEDPRLVDALLQEVDRENLLRAVRHVESHGNCKAVSRRGARGCYQTMPATEKMPGFGIHPMRNHSDKEQKRFAGDYLDVQERRYARMLAEAAYNAGPAAVDEAVRKAFTQLPKETREYTKKVEQQIAANEE